jgi:hypothetical protein
MSRHRVRLSVELHDLLRRKEMARAKSTSYALIVHDTGSEPTKDPHGIDRNDATRLVSLQSASCTSLYRTTPHDVGKEGDPPRREKSQQGFPSCVPSSASRLSIPVRHRVDAVQKLEAPSPRSRIHISD